MFGPLYDDFDPPPEAEGDEIPTPAAPSSLRSRLHVICALYAHTPQPERRLALLDHLERLTLEAATSLASHMLASGWRPRPSEETSEAA